jgi:hypothetical protein
MGVIEHFAKLRDPKLKVGVILKEVPHEVGDDATSVLVFVEGLYGGCTF